MPTKPVTIPEIWASNTLYTTGPFIGDPTKVGPGAAAQDGDRPGALFPTPAEYNNSQQYELTTWVATWLYFGTFNPDPDAHIVETDSTGRAGLHGLDVINGVDEIAVFIDGVNTFAPTVLATCTTGATVIQADVSNSTGTGFLGVIGTGAGRCLAASMTGSAAGAYGVEVFADNATAGDGIHVDHAGSGVGVLVEHSGTDAAVQVVHTGNVATAIVVTAGVNARAILAQGSGFGAGGRFEAGATCATAAVVASALTSSAFGVDATGGSGASTGVGVRGSGTHADACGVHGRTSTSASTTAAGVYGEGRGTGTIGVHAISTAGTALIVQGDTTSPANPGARFIPQTADPTNIPFGGEFLSNGTMNQLRHATGTGYKGIYQGGSDNASACLVNDSSDGPFTSNSSVIWTTCLQPSLVDDSGYGYYGTAVGAELTITIWLTPRTQIAADATLSLQVLDNTDGGAVIFSRSGTGTGLTTGYRLQSATTDWLTSLSISFQYVPPNEGDLDLEIQIRVGDNAGANIEARDVGCQIWGTLIP